MSDWARLEDDAVKKISDVMRLLVRRRWDKASPADKAAAVKSMAAGRKKARRKARGRR